MTFLFVVLGSGVRWFVMLCILSLCLVYVCGVCVLCCVV